MTNTKLYIKKRIIHNQKRSFSQVEADPRRVGQTKQVDVGICGDVRQAAQVLFDGLSSGQLTCNINREERLRSFHEVFFHITSF